MSQAGEVNVVQNHPEIPTMFVTDSGTAIPIANTLDILTNVTAAGTHPIQTTGATNVVTINAQKSQALAAADSTKIGLSNFSSAHFTVDANGFVDLAGGAVTETLTGNSGGAVGPDGANNINVVGDATTITISGNPGTNTLTASVTGSVGQTITGNSGGALSPTAGNWNILGASTAPGTTPVTTSGAVSTLTVDVQKTQAIVATDATKVGLAAFDSARFTADANGFVSINGSGIGETITGTTGGALSPTAGNWNILAAVTSAGTTPIQTAGAVSTLTIDIQTSQAIAATDATKIGLSNFNSAMFTVDANGFVSLSGGGQAIDSIAVQTGTSPIVPDGTGLVTINGATVLAGTHPVRTDGTGANTMAVEVQISQAIALTDATKVGLAAFDSAKFTTDANGFVSLNGSGVGETITGQSGGALSPTAGNWNISGASTAAGTSPVVTSGVGSTLTVNVQKAQAIAATDATKIGLAAFNSADFTVDANGFVGLSGTGVLETLTGNSGGAISPTGGNINTLGTGSITIAGAGSTLTTQLTGLTNHNVLVGAGTATITNVAPSATAGIPLVSNGAAADPSFTTAVVAGGGTGATSFTAYAPVIAGTTATGPFQSASTGLATAGFVLTSNGAAAVPSFQSVSASGAITTITGNSGGAESPTAGGNFNILGTGSITVAGSANTETVQLTGLTNHSLLVGAGTATITNLGVATNGQLPIGSAGADPVLATLTAGTGISIANGAGSITISTMGGSLNWVDQTVDLNPLVKNTAYEADKGTLLTLTLPTGATFGDTIRVQGFGAGGWTLNAGTGQTIQVEANATTVAGSVSSTNRYDYIQVTCSSTTTTWFATAHGGNLTLA